MALHHLFCFTARFPGMIWRMKSIPFSLAACTAIGCMMMIGVASAETANAPAQSASAPAPGAGTVGSAFEIARQAVKPELQTKVVSVYGTGTTAAIDKWYIIFFDPSVASHGRAVLVENGKIAKTYAANGGVTYAKDLTFDPSRITSEVPALSAAQRYATKHKITYDAVHALLKETALNKPFRWRVELLHVGHSRGFVYVNALDDSVASYQSPSAKKASSGDSDNFGDDVKNTFLGIGGDLQQFFTGERTVDK
jgi:hypothetical protein